MTIMTTHPANATAEDHAAPIAITTAAISEMAK
jgi:hypothetical protein